MHAKEMILTGLGLFSISHANQEMLFTGIVMLKFLVSAVLFSRGLLLLTRGKPTHLIPTPGSLHCKVPQQRQKLRHP